jgi:hypothetical protein
MKEANTSDKVIVTYKNVEYNVTNFLNSHPGGPKVISDLKNSDITQAFDEVGHSKKALRIMEKYRVFKEDDGSGTKKSNDVGIRYIYRKLFTKEDEYFIHKTLGLLSILSFTYRYAYVLPSEGNLGMAGALFDHFNIAIHWFLSISSLIFHVLRYRIPTKPIIIWEEYRLHAITFTTKAVSASVLGMNQKFITDHIGETATKIALAAIMFAHVIVADEITKRYGTPGISSVRIEQSNTAKRDTASMKIMRRFYSFFQICGAGGTLILDPRLGDFGFNTLIAIQSSAFLMTLFRKSIIRWYYYVLGYTFCLLISLYVMTTIKSPIFFINMFVIFLLRTQFNMNKYVLWMGYLMIVLLVADPINGGLPLDGPLGQLKSRADVEVGNFIQAWSPTILTILNRFH